MTTEARVGPCQLRPASTSGPTVAARLERIASGHTRGRGSTTRPPGVGSAVEKTTENLTAS